MKKTIHRILILFILMLLLIAVFMLQVMAEAEGTFAGGDGSPEDPYQIETAEQLATVAESVYLDEYFVLTADINLDAAPYNTGDGWLPIGTEATPFTGSFDGNGFIITGLYIDREAIHYVGLFGYIDSVNVIQNVELEEVNVTGEGVPSVYGGPPYYWSTVGSLAGRIDNGTITNCRAEGSVTVIDYGTAGGLAGHIDNGTITNCRTEVNVTGGTCGGLVGRSNNSIIDDCRAQVGVQGSVVSKGNGGGLVGRSEDCTITNCRAEVSVTGGYQALGGLVGDNSGDITGSSATGNVTGSCWVGGLVGYNIGSIADSFATGSVTGNKISTVDNGYGGLVGYSYYGMISKCYAAGDVSSDYEKTGGLVGYTSSGTVIDSYAIGDVTGVEIVGGLVGESRDSNIIYCYAMGGVTGDDIVGGLVGKKWDSSGMAGITASYYDSDNAGQPHNGYGEPRTTFRMQTPTTFTGWDFIDVWGINPDPEQNGGYPFLRWQTEYTDEQFTGGTGDPEAPYQIATPWQLNNIKKYLDKHFVQLNNIDMSVAPYNVDEGWEPIGIWANFFDPGNDPFTGNFEGGGYIIDNLYINRPGMDSVGLFSCIEGAAVRNVRLENVTVTGKNYVGGLVGHNLGLVTGTCVTGSVAGTDSVGGLVGQNFYNGSIEGCFADATVNGTGDNIGGLLGSNYNGEVTGSYAAGVVTGSSKVGGLAGYSDGDINGCYATGVVTAIESSAGGLVGYKPGGTVTASYYDSDTTGQSDIGKGEPKITEEMKQQATFVGWDFAKSGIWRNVEEYTYPVLQWQSFSTQEIDATITKDREDLAIVFAEGDSEGSVTRNLTLPEAGANGTTINWVSDNISVIANDGTVTTPFDENKAVILTATISRAGGTEQTKEFTLTVVPKVLESITITTPPAKLIYMIGDALDISGMVVTGTYNDNSTEELTVTPDNISGYDSSAESAGQVVTVTYEGKTATFTVDIVIVQVTYTVTYNANGGTGAVPTESDKIQGEIFTAASAGSLTPPEGKEFKEWNTKEDGTGTAYMSGAQVTMPEENLTLYAIWEDIPYVPSDNANLSGLVISAGTLGPDFEENITSYSASVGSGITSIEITPTLADSKAAVTVNGIEVDNGNTRSVSLNTGANTITLVVTAENGLSTKTYTITVNRESSGRGGNGGGGSGGTQTSRPVYAPVVDSSGNITTVPKLDRNTGVAAVSIDTATLTKAFEKSAVNSDGKSTVEIEIQTVENASTYMLALPASALSSSGTDQKLKIKSSIASVILPGNMLPGIAGDNVKEAAITIGRGNKSLLPDDVKAALGDRPLVQLSLTLDGNQVEWDNPDAPVTVSIPYRPTAAELSAPEHITVWYIDGSGNVVSVPNGRYDPGTGNVIFTTTHFSHYAVAYVTKSFNDLDSVAWAKKPIQVLASKGILKGISETEYAPQINITRADFLYYLVRTLGVDAKVDGNFDDIGKGIYYYKEIGIAKKLGITGGTGNNKFNPDASITRQDMMVLTERALRMLKKLEVQDSASELGEFSDKSLVADYAVDGVAVIIKEGLIVGSGGRINPLGSTTRAEAAMILYRIYNRFYGD